MWFVLLLCFIAAFADVIGGALTVFKKMNQQEILLITSLGSGFLLGATLLDRLPESMGELPNTAPLYITIGYLLLLIGGNLTAAHLHNGNDEYLSNHQSAAIKGGEVRLLKQERNTQETTSVYVSEKSALASFISLLLHTFVDGVIIAGAFTINRSTGILIFLAISLHKIPEGFSMASLYLAAGKPRKRAILTSLGLALSTLIGALITLQLKSLNSHIITILMALATGTFLYISTSELIPAIRGNKRNIWAAVIGVFIFYLSLLLIKHVGLS